VQKGWSDLNDLHGKMLAFGGCLIACALKFLAALIFKITIP